MLYLRRWATGPSPRCCAPARAPDGTKCGFGLLTERGGPEKVHHARSSSSSSSSSSACVPLSCIFSRHYYATNYRATALPSPLQTEFTDRVRVRVASREEDAGTNDASNHPEDEDDHGQGSEDDEGEWGEGVAVLMRAGQ